MSRREIWRGTTGGGAARGGWGGVAQEFLAQGETGRDRMSVFSSRALSSSRSELTRVASADRSPIHQPSTTSRVLASSHTSPSSPSTSSTCIQPPTLYTGPPTAKVAVCVLRPVKWRPENVIIAAENRSVCLSVMSAVDGAAGCDRNGISSFASWWAVGVESAARSGSASVGKCTHPEGRFASRHAPDARVDLLPELEHDP